MAFGDHAFGDVAFGGIPAPRLFASGFGAMRMSFDFTIYAASAEFITESDDTPSNQPFFGTLTQPLSYSASILGAATIGQYTAGTGEIDLGNQDGSYDFLVQQYAIDGRKIVVKLGRLGDPYADAPVVFSGTASDWQIDEQLLHVLLEDASFALSVPFQTNVYGGAGGSDGGLDLVALPKPRALGQVLNVQPPQIDPANRVYQVNDGPISGIPAVYDRGSALAAGADYATYSALIAAVIAGGTYATCLAQGYFRLESAPAGTVTADVNGDASGSGYVSTTADIVRRIIGLATTLVDPDDLYLPSINALDTIQPATVGYWADQNDSSTVADVIANLMGGIGGWAGFRRCGKLDLQIFNLPTGVVPLARWDRSDILAITRLPLPSGLSPPPWRQRVGYQRNWTVQTDLAGSVAAARVVFLAQQYRVAESSSASVKADHPLAQDPSVIQSFFANQSDAQAESLRLLTVYKSTRALYQMEIDIHSAPMDRDIGDVILVTYPRFDLTTGRLLRIVAMVDDASNNKVTITAYG